MVGNRNIGLKLSFASLLSNKIIYPIVESTEKTYEVKDSKTVFMLK